jgi:hypothetical protein
MRCLFASGTSLAGYVRTLGAGTFTEKDDGQPASSQLPIVEILLPGHQYPMLGFVIFDQVARQVDRHVVDRPGEGVWRGIGAFEHRSGEVAAPVVVTTRSYVLERRPPAIGPVMLAITLASPEAPSCLRLFGSFCRMC